MKGYFMEGKTVFGRWRLFVLTLALVLTSACTDSSVEDTGDTSGAKPVSSKPTAGITEEQQAGQPETAALSPSPDEWVRPKANRRYKLGVLFPFLASPFWVNEAYGVLDEAKKVGVDVVWFSADGYENVDKQNSQLEDLIALRVDAILLASTSLAGTARAVDQATERGIPVITHVTSSNTKNLVSAVLDNDLEIGAKQAQFMGKALGGKGQVVMLNGPAGAEWSLNRVKGFKQTLISNSRRYKVLAERFGIPDRADAQRLTEDLLAAFPQINGLFTVADGMAMGAADAVIAAGRIDEITITTASFSRESVPYIRKGYIDLNVDESPVLEGRWAVDIAVRHLNGEKAPKLIFVPNPEITRENVDRVSPEQQWAPDGWKIR